MSDIKKIKVRNGLLFKEIVLKIGILEEVEPNRLVGNTGCSIIIDKNMVIIEDGYYEVYSILANYFMFEVIRSKYDNQKTVAKYFNKRINNSYDDVLIMLEIERYFINNDVLDEVAFMRFNMSGFIKELDYCEKKELKRNGLEELKLKIEKDFKEHSHFKEFIIAFRGENVVLKSATVPLELTISNFKEHMGLDIIFGEEDTDIDVKNLIFCKIMAQLFDTSCIYISRKDYSFYKLLRETFSYENLEVNMLLIE